MLSQASQTVSLSLISKRSAKGMLFGALCALLRRGINNYRFVDCLNALDINASKRWDTRHIPTGFIPG